MFNLNQIGQIVNAVRNQKKLSQSELANQVGVNQATVSRVEKGNPNIKLDVYNRVLNGLNLSVYDEDELQLDEEFKRMYTIYETYTTDDLTEIEQIYQKVIHYQVISIKEYPIYRFILLLYHYINKNLNELDVEMKFIESFHHLLNDYYQLKFNQLSGLVYMYQSDFTKALPYLEQSIIHCDKHQLDEGLIYYHYGYLNFYMGNYTTSIVAINQAKIIYTKLNNRNRLNNIDYLCGLIYMNDRNYEEAEQIFLKLLQDDIYLSRNKSAYYIVIRNLGLVKFYQKEYQKAADYFMILYQIDYSPNRTVAFFMLLSLYYSDQKKYQEILNEFKQNTDEMNKKIVDIFNRIDQRNFNNSLLSDILQVVSNYNTDCFINYLIEEISDRIYNARKYSTYKSMIDLFLKLKVKV